MPERDERWDFDANMLPLDFANTAEWHAAPEPTERINSYRDLIEWSLAAGLLEETEAEILLDRSIKDPDNADRVLAKAIETREAIYAIFSAVTSHEELPGGALQTFNKALAESMKYVHISQSDAGFEWSWASAEHLDCMLWPILHATAELLTSDDLDRVGECEDDRGCGYLFYDTSRNRSRRWCNMEACGNRAKVRRHYQRKLKKESAPS